MLKNHKRSNKNRTAELDQLDIQEMYYLMNDERRKQNQIKIMNGDTEGFKPSFATGKLIAEKYRFTRTNEINGICLNCNQKRCPVCSGCPNVDIETQVINYKCDESTPLPSCQRCTCKTYECECERTKTKCLNWNEIDELKRKRQGPGFRSKKKNGGLKQ